MEKAYLPVLASTPWSEEIDFEVYIRFVLFEFFGSWWTALQTKYADGSTAIDNLASFPTYDKALSNLAKRWAQLTDLPF